MLPLLNEGNSSRKALGSPALRATNHVPRLSEKILESQPKDLGGFSMKEKVKTEQAVACLPLLDQPLAIQKTNTSLTPAHA